MPLIAKKSAWVVLLPRHIPNRNCFTISRPPPVVVFSCDVHQNKPRHPASRCGCRESHEQAAYGHRAPVLCDVSHYAVTPAVLGFVQRTNADDHPDQRVAVRRNNDTQPRQPCIADGPLHVL